MNKIQTIDFTRLFKQKNTIKIKTNKKEQII